MSVEWINRFLIGGLRPEDISYVHDFSAAAALAREKKATAIFVKPFPVARIREAVAALGLLPPKSTYFYPKVPSGLALKLAR